MAATQDNAVNTGGLPLAQRRGFFKIPPLTIPGRKRAKTDAQSPGKRQDSMSVLSPKSASKAFASIGSAISKIGSNNPTLSSSNGTSSETSPRLRPKSDHIAWQGFASPPTEASKNTTKDEGEISPHSRPGLERGTSAATGVLPDDSSAEDVFEDAESTIASTEDESELEQLIQDVRLASEAEAAAAFSNVGQPTLTHGSSQGQHSRPSLKLDTSMGREYSDPFEADLSSPDFTFPPETCFAEKTAIASGGPSSQTKAQQSSSSTAATNDWDPADPGHDTWREQAKCERQKTRSKVITDMSSFNWRNALRRRKTPPAPSLSPRGSATDGVPVMPADVGNLIGKAKDKGKGKGKAPSAPELPAKKPPPMTRTTRSGSIVRDFGVPKDTLPDLPVPKATEKLNPPQSKFISNSNSEDDNESTLTSSSSSSTNDHPFRPPSPPSPHPRIIPPRKHKRSRALTANDLCVIRSRGESIGLPPLANDRHALAAGYEIHNRQMFRSTGCGEKFQLCEKRGQMVLESIGETEIGNGGNDDNAGEGSSGLNDPVRTYEGEGKGRERGTTM